MKNYKFYRNKSFYLNIICKTHLILGTISESTSLRTCGEYVIILLCVCVLYVTHHLFEGNWNLVNSAIASLSLTAFETEVDSTAVTVGPDSFPENNKTIRASQKDR